eukprot:m.113622 g.113622  ORF g.113622 m.113622 type:complete len:53 (-) comp17090_c0_seq6:339-497(-)
MHPRSNPNKRTDLMVVCAPREELPCAAHAETVEREFGWVTADLMRRGNHPSH